MSRRGVTQARTYREVHAALARSPNLAGMRNGGAHVVYSGRNGYSVPVPRHNGDVPSGTLRAIIRLALLAGLGVVVVGVVVLMI